MDSDVELAVDHLTRLLLTDEDERVRSARPEHVSFVSSPHFYLLETNFVSLSCLWLQSLRGGVCRSLSRAAPSGLHHQNDPEAKGGDVFR